MFDCLILTNQSGEILSLNRPAIRLFQASMRQVIGTSIFELIPSHQLKMNFFSVADKTGIPISLGTQQLVCNISGVLLDSSMHGYLLSLKNITQLQLLQHQLHQMNETKHLYSSILDHLEEGICVIDQQGKILFYNRKMGEIDSKEPDSVRGKQLTEVWNKDESSSTLLTALKTGRTLSNHKTHFVTNGKTITTVTKTLPLFLEEQKVGALEISKDITEQKQLADSILQLQHRERGPHSSSIPASRHTNTRFLFSDICFISQEMKQTVEQAKRSARSSSGILIIGETGTGKELFAQSIHNESPRQNKPFIALNCAALPESLLEGLLFGTTVGSFTGAVDRAGLFEQANGGTLLLDEINSMGVNLQAKLLRVLQEKKIQRLGSTKLVDIDVRVIATINEDPLEAIADNKLREDLFYRLQVVSLVIPPLRKRKEDIPFLINHFIEKHSRILGMKVEGVTDELHQFFLGYHWPGNVRQLEHTIEGALNLVHDESYISFDHLPSMLVNNKNLQIEPANGSRGAIPDSGTLPECIERLERTMIQNAMRVAKGNITKASEQLGISRQNLNYKLKKFASN